jgi:hypothetical protein
MYPTTNTSSEMIAMFGSAYVHERHFDEGVHERHFDEGQSYLAPEPKLTLDFDAMLKALRSALSLGK